MAENIIIIFAVIEIWGFKFPENVDIKHDIYKIFDYLLHLYIKL